MRVLLLPNNWTGWQVTEWLSQQPDEIVGLLMHSPGGRQYGDEIIRSAGVGAKHIFDDSSLKDPTALQAIKDLKADVAVSLFFGHILPDTFIDLFPRGVINLHPAYLPFNRGRHPNVWSIIEETPAGVTLHYIDAGVDTGDIIAQRDVQKTELDTGETLYHRLEQASVQLFKEAWPDFRVGKSSRLPQDLTKGTTHISTAVDDIDEIVLDRTYTARQLLNVMRARTFPPYRGAFFRAGNRKIHVRLQLIDEDEL